MNKDIKFWLYVSTGSFLILILSIFIGRLIGNYLIRSNPSLKVHSIKIPNEYTPLTPKVEIEEDVSEPSKDLEAIYTPTSSGRTTLAKSEELKPKDSINLSKLYKVQIGVFQNKENAERLMNEVKGENTLLHPYIKITKDNEKTFYKVQLGAFKERENAEKMAKSLRELGYEVYIHSEP